MSPFLFCFLVFLVMAAPLVAWERRKNGPYPPLPFPVWGTRSTAPATVDQGTATAPARGAAPDTLVDSLVDLVDQLTTTLVDTVDTLTARLDSLTDTVDTLVDTVDTVDTLVDTLTMSIDQENGEPKRPPTAPATVDQGAAPAPVVDLVPWFQTAPVPAPAPDSLPVTVEVTARFTVTDDYLMDLWSIAFHNDGIVPYGPLNNVQAGELLVDLVSDLVAGRPLVAVFDGRVTGGR